MRTGRGRAEQPGRQGLDPGWRPAAAPPPPARTVAEPIDPVLLTGARHPPDERALVTVRRGDTLWDLAARGLGPTASDAEIAAEWPRWYAANRDVVGADPDLLAARAAARRPGRRRRWAGRVTCRPREPDRSSQPSTGASD